jgi:hypothetical protein
VKSDPRRLVRAHYATYVDARTGKVRILDHLAFEGIPLLVAGACALGSVKLPPVASVSLLTVAGLLSAFLFGAMLQISERAMGWADAVPGRGPETSTHAIFLKEIAANAGYASLVSIATATVFTAASATTKPRSSCCPRSASASWRISFWCC